MDIEIRRAGVSDIEEMSVVVDSAWRENYREFFTEEQIAAYTGEKRRRSFVKLINDGIDIFVLLFDGRITAVCAAKSCEETCFKEYAEIMLLYVHPDYQKTGQGRKLLSHALRKMSEKGYKGAVLNTAEKNENARRFYGKFGFTAQDHFEQSGITYVTYTIDF